MFQELYEVFQYFFHMLQEKKQTQMLKMKIFSFLGKFEKNDDIKPNCFEGQDEIIKPTALKNRIPDVESKEKGSNEGN